MFEIENFLIVVALALALVTVYVNRHSQFGQRNGGINVAAGMSGSPIALSTPASPRSPGRRVVRVGWLSGSAEHLVNLPYNLTATCGCCRSLRRHTGSAAAAGATTRAAPWRGAAPHCEAQANPRVARPRLGKLRTLVSSP